MNKAAGIEGYTRVVKKSIVLSELVKLSCKKEWEFIRMGQFYLKGKRQHIVVYSINHELLNNFKNKAYLSSQIEEFVQKINKK